MQKEDAERSAQHGQQRAFRQELAGEGGRGLRRARRDRRTRGHVWLRGQQQACDVCADDEQQQADGAVNSSNGARHRQPSDSCSGCTSGRPVTIVGFGVEHGRMRGRVLMVERGQLGVACTRETSGLSRPKTWRYGLSGRDLTGMGDHSSGLVIHTSRVPSSNGEAKRGGRTPTMV